MPKINGIQFNMLQLQRQKNELCSRESVRGPLWTMDLRFQKETRQNITLSKEHESKNIEIGETNMLDGEPTIRHGR